MSDYFHIPTDAELKGRKTRAEGRAWMAVEGGFDVRLAHLRDDEAGAPALSVELAYRLRVIQVATEAYVALKELQFMLLDYDVASLVHAACGTGPFCYAAEMRERPDPVPAGSIFTHSLE